MGTLKLTDQVEQFNRRETAVSNKDYGATWQPAHECLNHLPCPLKQSLRSAFALLLEPPRRIQHPQKVQCPHALSPPDFDQQHRTEPAQAGRFNEMRMGGAHRITIDIFNFDLVSTSSLDVSSSPQTIVPVGVKVVINNPNSKRLAISGDQTARLSTLRWD